MRNYKKLIDTLIIQVTGEVDEITGTYERNKMKLELVKILQEEQRQSEQVTCDCNCGCHSTEEFTKEDIAEEVAKEDNTEDSENAFVDPELVPVEDNGIFSDVERTEDVTAENVIQMNDVLAEHPEEDLEGDDEAVITDSDEPIIVRDVEDKDVDVTYAYTLLMQLNNNEMEVDDALSLALTITQLECLEKYGVISQIPVNDEDAQGVMLIDSTEKVYLAYYIAALEASQCDIADYVSAFSDGAFTDFNTFINNHNMGAFVDYLEICFAQGEE